MKLKDLFNGFLIFSIFSLTFCGCAPKAKPKVWVDREFSFTNYRSVEVRPVINAPDRPAGEDVLIALNNHLKNRLEMQGISVVESSEKEGNTLIVQGNLLNYEVNRRIETVRPMGSGAPGESRCTFRILLSDRGGRVVAGVVASRAIAAGVRTSRSGPSVVLSQSDEGVLKEVADAVADEVAKLMAGPG